MIRLALLLGTGYMAYRYLQKQKQSTLGSGLMGGSSYEGTGTSMGSGGGVAGMGATGSDATQAGMRGNDLSGGGAGSTGAYGDGSYADGASGDRSSGAGVGGAGLTGSGGTTDPRSSTGGLTGATGL